MHKPLYMAVIDCTQKLLHDIHSMPLGKIITFFNKRKHTPSLAELHYKVVVFLVLENLVGSQDIGVVHFLKDIKLLEEALS